MPLTSRLSPLLLSATLLVTSPLLAVNKETIQLQTQIQQLQDAVARLQQSNDERMGVLTNLVQQSADSVNKMSTTVDAVQHQLQAQHDTEGGKVEQVSGQVQALNDSLDEIKARMARLEKLMQEIQSQQSSSAASLPSAGSSGTSAPATAPPPPQANGPAASADTNAIPLRGTKPSAAVPFGDSDSGAAPGTLAGTPASSAGGPTPPADELYRAALGDYMSAKYGLAESEFSDVTRAYPENPLSGSALYYQGEIEFRGGRYGAAVKDYDRVIEQFPDSNKVPAAHLHKGQSLIQLKQNEAGVRELRALIQRFPNSPEATQARSRLNGMGITVKPKA